MGSELLREWGIIEVFAMTSKETRFLPEIQGYIASHGENPATYVRYRDKYDSLPQDYHGISLKRLDTVTYLESYSVLVSNRMGERSLLQILIKERLSHNAGTRDLQLKLILERIGDIDKINPYCLTFKLMNEIRPYLEAERKYRAAQKIGDFLE